MEESKHRGKGRPTNEKLRAVIVEISKLGLGYDGGVQMLKDAGFVDEDGNCTVTRSNFGYMKKKVGVEREFRINVDADQYDWAMSHKEEIIQYIQMRYNQDTK